MYILIGIVVILVLIFSYLLLNDRSSKSEDGEKETKQDSVQDSVQNNRETNKEISKDVSKEEDHTIAFINNILYPKEFNAGTLLDDKSNYARDICVVKKENCVSCNYYPINSVDVDYGWKFPECRCNEFIRAP
jgi:hypothetical protein